MRGWIWTREESKDGGGPLPKGVQMCVCDFFFVCVCLHVRMGNIKDAAQTIAFIYHVCAIQVGKILKHLPLLFEVWSWKYPNSI